LLDGEHVTIFLGGQDGDTPVTIPMYSGSQLQVFQVTPVDRKLDPAVQGIPDKKIPVDIGILQARLGHRAIRSIMAADRVGVWEDTTLKLTPDPICSDAELAVIKKGARSKTPQVESTYKYERLDLDVINNPAPISLTPKSYFPFYLMIVDHFSRFPTLVGIECQKGRAPTAEQVIELVKSYCGRHLESVREIRSDAGCQFDSEAFKSWCKSNSIIPSKATPHHQEQNEVAERT